MMIRVTVLDLNALTAAERTALDAYLPSGRVLGAPALSDVNGVGPFIAPGLTVNPNPMVTAVFSAHDIPPFDARIGEKFVADPASAVPSPTYADLVSAYEKLVVTDEVTDAVGDPENPAEVAADQIAVAYTRSLLRIPETSVTRLTILIHILTVLPGAPSEDLANVACRVSEIANRVDASLDPDLSPISTQFAIDLAASNVTGIMIGYDEIAAAETVLSANLGNALDLEIDTEVQAFLAS